MSKFKPENTTAATPEQLEDIAVIIRRDWQQAIASADPNIKPYLQARETRARS